MLVSPAAPIIVTPPGEVYNVSGSQVYLSCEAVGVPTPVLTWKKVRTEISQMFLPMSSCLCGFGAHLSFFTALRLFTLEMN